MDKGEVIALLDIAKCLHDAIIRMERIAERQKVMAAAVEGAEKHWGAQMTGKCLCKIFYTDQENMPDRYLCGW